MSRKRMSAGILSAAVLLFGAIFLGQLLSSRQQLEFGVGKPEYMVNGTVKQFDENTETLPLLDEETNTLMLPLRLVIEEMGGTLEWNQANQTVVIRYKGTSMEVKESSQHAVIDGYGIVLYEAPQNINGCLYVSSDFIADNLGTDIDWIEEKNQIVIQTESKKRPVVNRNVLEYDGASGSYYIEIPVITGLNDKNYERELNHSFFNQTIEAVRAYVLENDKKNEEGNMQAPYTWTLKMQIDTRSSGFISILQENYQKDLESGGHGKTSYFSINIDLQTQSFPTLSELFKNKKYKSALLREVNQLIDSDSVRYPIARLSAWNDKDEEIYTIRDGQLVLIKNVDDGYIQFAIPAEELKRYWKDGYLEIWQEGQVRK